MRVKNRIFYFGISQTMAWFDFINWFSIDMGRWYVRLFFRILDFRHCRYYGVIAEEK